MNNTLTLCLVLLIIRIYTQGDILLHSQNRGYDKNALSTSTIDVSTINDTIYYSYKYPLCIRNESDLVYVNDAISASQIMTNCITNIPDPYNIPTFYNGSFIEGMTIFSNIQINNLHEVDAVSGTVTIDFYLRLYWRDNRFNMPLFWEKLDQQAQGYGVEITKLIDLGGTPIWLPDLHFHDAASLDVIIDVSSLHYPISLLSPSFTTLDNSNQL